MSALGDIDRGDRPTVEIDYAKPREQRPTPIGRIPSYRFIPLGIGCAAHGQTDCLCDVIVSSETPITHSLTELVYGGIATKVNGPPTQHNIVRWASTLFGCVEMAATLVERQDMDGNVFERPAFQMDNDTGWSKLGQEIRDDLRWYGTRKGITFSMVEHLVPAWFTDAERHHVRKMFNKYKTDHNNQTRSK